MMKTKLYFATLALMLTAIATNTSSAETYQEQYDEQHYLAIEELGESSKYEQQLASATPQEAKQLQELIEHHTAQARKHIRRGIKILGFMQEVSPEIRTMIFDALEEKKYTTVSALLRIGIDPLLQSDKGSTIFSSLVAAGEIDHVLMLLLDGTNPDAPDAHGRTPLMITSSGPIASLLLQHGADPTLEDNNGNTALDHAAERNHVAVAEVLLGCPKVDINSFNTTTNTTAIDHAIEKEHYYGVVALLIKHGAIIKQEHINSALLGRRILLDEEARRFALHSSSSGQASIATKRQECCSCAIQ